MPAQKQPKPELVITVQMVIIFISFKAGQGQLSTSGKNPGVLPARRLGVWAAVAEWELRRGRQLS